MFIICKDVYSVARCGVLWFGPQTGGHGQAVGRPNTRNFADAEWGA